MRVWQQHNKERGSIIFKVLKIIHKCELYNNIVSRVLAVGNITKGKAGGARKQLNATATFLPIVAV